MFRTPSETTTSFTPKTPKSGFAAAKIHAINPTKEEYKRITGRELNYDVDYSPKDNKGLMNTPLRILISVGGEFIFAETWGLENRVPVSSKNGGTVMYLDNTNGETAWTPTIEKAVEKFSFKTKNGKTHVPVVTECKAGTEIVAKILAGIPETHYKDFYYPELEADVWAGNWSKFNKFIHEKSLFMEFVFFFYSVTNDKGYVYLKNVTGYMQPVYKFKSPTNISYESKGILSQLEKEFFQKPEVFCANVQWGLMEQNDNGTIVPNTEVQEKGEFDDLPF